MAKKTKFYVVWEGSNTGIFDTWEECKLSVQGYPNPKYKSFSSKEEAIAAYRGHAADYIGNSSKKSSSKSSTPPKNAKIIWKSISVDAACSGNPGIVEYRGVDTKTKVEFFRQGPFKQGTNNIGEFLALVHALARFQKLGDYSTPIYSDSRTAMAWVRNKKVKTTLKKNQANAILFDLIDRAITWLENNEYKNPILKWDTPNWGEIPADFGRK